MHRQLRSFIKQAYYLLIGPQIRRRQNYRNSMPKALLSCRHTASCTVLPDRSAMLRRMKKGGIVMELGVARGDFSAEILMECVPRRLLLVDAWHTPEYEKYRDDVARRFEVECAKSLVEIRQGLSTEVLSEIADGFLDWIYIDTNHSYETTAAELLQADRVVRSDGLIAGHDFCLGNIVKPVVFGVIQAVNEFCVERNWRFKYITLESSGYFSFCLERIAGNVARLEPESVGAAQGRLNE